MQNHILIDIGSSSVKVYLYQNNKLQLIQTRSIPFKNRFTPETGLSDDHKHELFQLINDTKTKFPDCEIHLYATAIFRKFSPDALTKFKKELKTFTNLTLNIITQDEENKYLELALAEKFHTSRPILLINIGGGSTELVILEHAKAIERKNIDIGVGTILANFQDINSVANSQELEKVKLFVSQYLPAFAKPVSVAFYTGGELTYMRLAGYNLEPNNLFNDADHPYVITLKNFQVKNMELFDKLTLSDLESLMPDNPKWMHGARACSAFAQALCEFYNIQIIIPSDANLVNGIVRKEFNVHIDS